MYERVCECCGKVFLSKSNLKKCCSKECAKEMAKKRQQEKGQLCCICKNACGNCSWSADFIPVEGWDAQPTIIKDSEGDFSSYEIKRCPEFIRG